MSLLRDLYLKYKQGGSAMFNEDELQAILKFLNEAREELVIDENGFDDLCELAHELC
jgi:hypothetical protein